MEWVDRGCDAFRIVLEGINGETRPLPSPANLASSSRAVPAAMARVHPKGVDLGEPGAVACIQGEEAWPEEAGTQASVLTVWRRSLLFNGNGFAVFDAKGNLAFRVDNYASGSKKEVVLMDGAGKPLLTIRRKVCGIPPKKV